MVIKLIAMDLDGTVLREDQSIHDDLPLAFARARENNIQLAIATGRAFQSTELIAQRIGFRGPLVCSNGSHTLNENWETIGSEYLDLEVQSFVLDYAHLNGIHVSAYGVHGVGTIQDSEWLAKYKLLVRGLDIPILGLKQLRTMPLFKIVFICPAEELPTHRKALEWVLAKNRAQLTESGPEYLEILPSNANKSNGLIKLSSYLGVDRTEVAAIGDYRNDIEMLGWANYTGAVQNALPEVKTLAKIVVKSNEEGGVAEFIDRCILLNSTELSES